MPITNSKTIKKGKEVITLSKSEFMRLKQQADAYRFLAAKIFELPLQDPIGEVVKNFQDTGLYTKEFLEDLESGLRKSSYVKKYANQTFKKGPGRIYQKTRVTG